MLHGLGLRVSVGDDKSFRGDLDAMVRAGMPGLCAVNPIATAWSQALPNIVNMVRREAQDNDACIVHGNVCLQVPCLNRGGLVDVLWVDRKLLLCLE